MSLRCTKAIIAVGGFGTRWLPMTKAIEKCMLPVGNRPVIDYIVDDCVKAGITEIYFVVAEQSEQIRRFYGDNDYLYKHLEQKGKTKELEQLQQISKKANFHFVIQGPSLPYGTAVPAMLCEEFVESDEQVVILMGDQFTYIKDGASEVGHLLKAVETSGVTAGMAAVHVPRKEVYKYGILELTQHEGKDYLKSIIEHPKVEEAPSTLNNLSMYVFDNELFGCLQHIKPTNGEYYIIDALNIYVEKLHKRIAVMAAKGEYLDCGTVEGWLRANEYMLQNHQF